MATRAAIHEGGSLRLLLRRSGEAHEPFGARELTRKVAGLLQLDRNRGGIVADFDRLRTIEVKSNRADAPRVVAGFELRGREAEITLLVAENRDADRRPRLRGGDANSLHGTLLSGGDLAGELAGGLRRVKPG